MNWLDKIFGRQSKSRESTDSAEHLLHDVLSQGRSTSDNLGAAAEAKHAALQAVRDKRFDDAWHLFHEQKSHYLQHAQGNGFTAREALALDGSVHEDLANIRRLENNHDDALIHMLYCVITSTKPTKSQQQKISAYFGRCKFLKATLSDVQSFVEIGSRNPNFRTIQLAVAQWRNGQ